jgi:hypothetical protein
MYNSNLKNKIAIAEVLDVDKEDLGFMIGLQGSRKVHAWIARIIGVIVIAYSIFRLVL